MQILKLLSDNTKLEILRYLIDCDCCDCICNIQDVIKKDHSVLVKDLKKLELSGLIWTKKEGKFLRCGIVDKEKIVKLLKLLEEF